MIIGVSTIEARRECAGWGEILSLVCLLEAAFQSEQWTVIVSSLKSVTTEAQHSCSQTNVSGRSCSTSSIHLLETELQVLSFRDAQSILKLP